MEGFLKYFKNTGWLLGTRIYGMAIGFFVTAIVIRYLGPTNNGILNYAISFVGLFGFIATLGLDNILYRDLVKYPEKENKYIGTSLILRLFASAIASVAAVILGYAFNSGDITTYTVVIISFAFFFQAFSVIIYAFQAKVQSHFPSIATIISITILAILKLLVINYHKGIYYFAAIYTFEPLLYALFYLFFFSRYYSSPFHWRFDRDIAKSLLKDSLPLMFSVVFIGIYSRIDQVLLKHFINVEAVGIYDPAVRLSEVWYFIPGIITSSLFPSIINAKKVGEGLYAKRLAWLTGLILALTIGAGMFVTFTAPFLMELVFGPVFVSGYKVLQLYVWSGVGFGLSLIATQFLLAEHMSKIVLYISIVGMAINVSLNLYLIPKFGINGSAFATLVSYIIGPLSILIFPAPRKKIFHLLKLI